MANKNEQEQRPRGRSLSQLREEIFPPFRTEQRMKCNLLFEGDGSRKTEITDLSFLQLLKMKHDDNN